MKKKWLYLILSAVILPLIISSDCTGDEPLNIPPELTIKGNNSIIIADTSFHLGDFVEIIITASEKIYPISHFELIIYNGSKKTITDTTFTNPLSSFSYKLLYYKSAAQTDTIIAIVCDSKGNEKQKTVYLHLSGSIYKPLLSFKDILLGARYYPGNKSFLSIFNDSVFTYDLIDAYNYQSRIDYFYYFYNQKYVMASPGAAFEPDLFSGATPKYDVNNWPLRNQTLYKSSGLSIQDFEKISTDSFLRNNADFTNAQDKVSMKTGNVYIFSTYHNKLGLMKINAVSGQDSGYVIFDLKIQK